MTNEHGPARPSRRTTFLVAVMLAAVWELVYLELFEPASIEFLEMNVIFAAALGSGLLVQWVNRPTNPRSRVTAIALCLALSSTGPRAALASEELPDESELPDEPTSWAEMGLGDDLPIGEPNLEGIPCWQLRMSDDIDSLIRYFWTTAAGSAISTSVYLLNTAGASGGVGAALGTTAGARAAAVPAAGALVAYVSWNGLMAEGCGGCGEEGSLRRWERGQCGAFKLDCCIPEGLDAPNLPEDREDDEDSDELADSGHDLDLPTAPVLQDTSSGFQGVEDLVDFGWLGGDGRPDPRPEDCIELYGAQCNGMCPPAGNGMCVNSCNTCGGCVYTDCM